MAETGGRRGQPVKRRLAWLLAIIVACGGAAFVILRSRGSVPPPPPTAARLAALTAERDRLQNKWREVLAAKGERSLADAPQADVMIGVPTAFTSSILEQAITGLLGETVLTLTNLTVHKAGEVKAKILFKKRTVGKYVLDVRIHKVQGILKPAKPTLAFGKNEVSVELPVHLAEGGGNADLRFRWDSKGLLPNVVCGDVDVTRGITGGVVPKDYRFSGSFAIAAAGEAIVLRPSFPRLAVQIFVDPSEQAWSVVDDVVRKRPKGCEIALNKIDIKEKLGEILGRGLNVKIPQKIFKPIRLPAGVRQSLNVQGVDLALRVKPTGVLVAEDRLWYGADVTVGTK